MKIAKHFAIQFSLYHYIASKKLLLGMSFIGTFAFLFHQALTTAKSSAAARKDASSTPTSTGIVQTKPTKMQKEQKKETRSQFESRMRKELQDLFNARMAELMKSQMEATKMTVGKKLLMTKKKKTRQIGEL